MSDKSESIKIDQNFAQHKAPAPFAVQIIGVSICLGLYGLLSGSIKLWDSFGQVLSPSFSYTGAVCITGILSGLIAGFRQFGRKFPALITVSPASGSWILLLFFVSDFLCRGFNLFQGPMIRGEIILATIIALFTLRFFSAGFFKFIYFSSAILLIAIFLYLSDGNPIISDDHASFLFRLNLLKQNFPEIPVYYPGWNAGLDARDFFATGALGYFLLSAPLHYLLDINLSHNLSLALILFGLMPLSLAYACRVYGLSRHVSWISALLSVATNLLWYRWALKYGTAGFVCSAALMPMVFALGSKLIHNEKLSKREFVIFIFTASVSLMWPLTASCYLALVLLAVCSFRTILKNKQFILAVALLILLNLPWSLVFWKVSNVGKFIGPSVQATSNYSQPDEIAYRHKNKGLDLPQALKVLRETANSANPLILLLSLPGLLLLPRRIKGLFAVQSAFFLLAGTLLVSVKPQLEADRFLIFLGIFLCIPVAQGMTFILKNSVQPRLLTSFVFSFLLLGPFVSANIIFNRSAENYQFAGSVSKELRKFAESYPSTGRFLFSGFVLHELDGGHVAPLSVWTKKPFIASSPFHNRWKYSSVFPDNFSARGDSGIRSFLDLNNVEIIFAHEAHWRRFFIERPDEYEIIWQHRPFIAFKRKNYRSEYFLEGQGRIKDQSGSGIILIPESQESVIKFNYFPFLQSSNCSISPQEAGLEFPFIRLSNCRVGEETIIKSVGPLSRVINGKN